MKRALPFIVIGIVLIAGVTALVIFSRQRASSSNAGAFVTVEGAGTFMKAATTSCKASLYSCLRACFARAAPIAVLTSLTSSGGGKTAFIPSPLIHNSRVHPVV